ncbi:MAG: hypothetical protein KAR42_14955 [candidate division Zixibacteria bacterium]|nr:hypothetical protein [candidate division Zixibacteria bacterium]
MALKTTTELLEEVETAISACLAGQAYSYKGKSVTRADLKDLMAVRRELYVDLDIEADDIDVNLATFQTGDY